MPYSSVFNVEVKVDASVLDGIIARFPGVNEIIAGYAAEAVLEGALQNVPVLTGFLKSTGVKWTLGGGEWTVQFLAWYAGFVEFGTFKMAAQPYLMPAFEDVNWIGICQAAMSDIGF